MKRFLLVVLLAAVCVCLLVSPAVAAKTTDAYRPPEGVPMLAALGDGWWFEYQDTGDPYTDLTWSQASLMPPTGDPDMDAAWKPIPIEGARATLGWIGTTFGQTQNVSRVFTITVDVTGPSGFEQHVSPAEVEWTGAHEFDEWWQVFAGGSPELFNPSIAAGIYSNRPIAPIGPFPGEGWYHFSWSMDQVLPTLDHFFYDEDGDGVADWPGATHWPPGSNSWIFEFDFYVQ